MYVPRNHEYYGAHLHGLAVQMRKCAAALGIHYLDNDAVTIGNTRFLGTTLWTDFALNGTGAAQVQSLQTARRFMNNFTCIRFGSTGWFRPEQSIILHRAARAWLEQTLAIPHAGPTVVVTHHCPHPCSVPERFQGDELTPAFCSDLTAVMECHSPALWIHGHTHDAFDYTVGRTRVVCNPRGYPNERWHGFEAGKVVDVPGRCCRAAVGS